MKSILLNIVLIPIYHFPILFAFFMSIASQYSSDKNIIHKTLLITITLIIQFIIHSVPNICVYFIYRKIIKEKFNKRKFIIAESCLLILLILVYIFLNFI